MMPFKFHAGGATGTATIIIYFQFKIKGHGKLNLLKHQYGASKIADLNRYRRKLYAC